MDLSHIHFASPPPRRNGAPSNLFLASSSPEFGACQLTPQSTFLVEELDFADLMKNQHFRDLHTKFMKMNEVQTSLVQENQRLNAEKGALQAEIIRLQATRYAI
jgi:hypothetical protein